MPTLADMQASIASEIFRDDLGAQIAAEITRAIRFYQRKRFHFNETRSLTFNTVANQDFYGASAEPRIPNLLEIDYVQATQNTRPMPLRMVSAKTMDLWSGTPASGPPSDFSYFEGQLRLYPMPDQAYPVRVSGLIRVDPPTDAGGDQTNPWMNDGEELIRSRAKRNLYLHYLGDQEMGAVMKAAEDEALISLKSEANARQDVHAFLPSCI